MQCPCGRLKKSGVGGRAIHAPVHTDIRMASYRRFDPFADSMSQLKKNIKLILRKKPSKMLSRPGGLLNPKAIQRRFF